MKREISAGESIIRSAKQALDWAKGEDIPGVQVRTVMVPSVDVRRVRRKMKLSQNEFAARFGFSPGVLRNWEQGRNQPHGAARVLLAVIDRHPEAVEDSLHIRPPARKS